MRQSAAVLCQDKSSLQALGSTLEQLGIDLVSCPSQQKALELVMTGRCTTLIVDFDLPGAEEVIRMAALSPAAHGPGPAGHFSLARAAFSTGLWRRSR